MNKETMDEETMDEETMKHLVGIIESATHRAILCEQDLVETLRPFMEMVHHNSRLHPMDFYDSIVDSIEALLYDNDHERCQMLARQVKSFLAAYAK